MRRMISPGSPSSFASSDGFVVAPDEHAPGGDLLHLGDRPGVDEQSHALGPPPRVVLDRARKMLAVAPAESATGR